LALLLSCALGQKKMQDVLFDSVDKYLLREELQGRIDRILDKYLLREELQGRIDRILDKYLLREISKTIYCKVLEDNTELNKLLWKACNVRSTSLDMHWATIPNSIREYRMIQATIEAGKFVQENIPNLEGKRDAFETLKFALDAVTVEGEYLEFGVYSGTTITFIANYLDSSQIVHGFDSFEGLPEGWGSVAKGTFDKKGELPVVPSNVVLHKGWFDETIDPFLEGTTKPVAFLHADADLYSSTATILSKLSDRIVKGTIIVFDEFINYPYWRDHEYKAFLEFIETTGHNFEYIAYTDRGYSVAVKIC